MAAPARGRRDTADRGDGVPYGLPDPLRESLKPIVARHLAAQRPDWRETTVDLTEPQRTALHQELLARLRSGWPA